MARQIIIGIIVGIALVADVLCTMKGWTVPALIATVATPGFAWLLNPPGKSGGAT